jgi:hypothetical protein
MKDINGNQLQVGSYVTTMFNGKKLHGVVSGIPDSFADLDAGFEEAKDIEDCVFVRFDELDGSDPRGEPWSACTLSKIF